MQKTPRPQLDRSTWIQAAFDTLADEGVGGIRVEILARRLHVTKGSFYWHFKDRQALLDGILETWKVGRIRDIVKQIYGFAILHGEKVANPADDVGPSSIATFVPKDRALSPTEIRLMHQQLEFVASYPTIRLALRMILLTLVRKSELIQATWDEVDFANALWTIPKERMKGAKAHSVYLSQQALDIMIALHTCAGGSAYVLPSRYDADKPMSNATLNRVTGLVVERAKAKGLPLESFTVHDLRRTGSTMLNELGFNSDWIEKCLAHEHGRSSRGVYNKAEYAEQRRHMLQEWADMIDAWVAGKPHTPTLLPPSMKVITTQALI